MKRDTKPVTEKITKLHVRLTSAVDKRNRTYKDETTKISVKWIEWGEMYPMSMKEQQGNFQTG